MFSPATTRTGEFPLGCRLTTELAKLSAAQIAAVALPRGLTIIDLWAQHTGELAAWQEAGFTLGTLDLFGQDASFTDMLSADAGKRRAAVAEAASRIRTAAAAGARKFFVVMLAEDVTLPRRETFRHMVDSYGRLDDVLRETGGRIAIEGWPGCNAHCCTPESCRAFFQAMNSDRYGLNFDPSHLIRMDIDPVRFLEEFAPHVVHAHGKDAVLDHERLYDFGREQAPVFADNLPWGGAFWRYTIPGGGLAPWPRLLEILRRHAYAGAVSVELEDKDYNGSVDGEQRGFLTAAEFLRRQ